MRLLMNEQSDYSSASYNHDMQILLRKKEVLLRRADGTSFGDLEQELMLKQQDAKQRDADRKLKWSSRGRALAGGERG